MAKIVVHSTIQQVPGDDLLLFNTSEFIGQFNIKDALQFILLDSKNDPAAYLNLFKHDTTLFSPFMAPYGGIEYLKTVPAAVMKEFIKSVIDHCKKENTEHLIIKSPPTVYNDFTVDLESILTDLSFEHTSQATQIIKVSPFDKRQTNVSILPDEEIILDELHDFLDNSHLHNTDKFNITKEQLEQMISHNEDNTHVLPLYIKSIKIGFAITLKAKNDIVYLSFPIIRKDYYDGETMQNVLKATAAYYNNFGVSLDLGQSSIIDYDSFYKYNLSQLNLSL